jgi:hypothetical protein
MKGCGELQQQQQQQQQQVVDRCVSWVQRKRE